VAPTLRSPSSRPWALSPWSRLSKEDPATSGPNPTPVHTPVPECCTLASAGLETLPAEQQTVVRRLLPSTATLLILAHRVTHDVEWIWYHPGGGQSPSTCAADLHSQVVLGGVACSLREAGHRAFFVPYPAKIGINFKRVAVVAGLGELGWNHLLIHPVWGNHVHLRVLLTDAELHLPRLESRLACLECGECVRSCPAKALSPSRHDVEACAAYQVAHFPAGQAPGPKCEICLRACPLDPTASA